MSNCVIKACYKKNNKIASVDETFCIVEVWFVLADDDYVGAIKERKK